MPKSTPALSKHSPTGPPPSRMSDVAMRKKKNADAQAAFRARRANYIATLEETVTSLESVVLQLQESCRDAKDQNIALQQENSRLRLDFEKREKFWRTICQAKKAGQDVDPDDSAYVAPPISYPAPIDHGASSQSLPHYDSLSVSYTHGTTSMAQDNTYEQYHCSIPYSSIEANSGLPTEGSASTSHRSSRFSPYQYSVQTVQRDTSWSSRQSASPDNDLGVIPHVAHSRSPNFGNSPTVTTHHELSYPRNGHHDDEQGSLSSLDAAPYMFHTSGSLSPSSSTPPSSTYPFNARVQEHASDYDYRRQQPTEIALHNGTADTPSMDSFGDMNRLRLSSRLPLTGLASLPSIPPPSMSLLHDDSSTSSLARGAFGSRSRSSSPGAPAISGTLAVIKAQAFGALRRTRTRSKKSSDGAAKVAFDILEGRGMGIGGTDFNHGSQHSDDEE